MVTPKGKPVARLWLITLHRSDCQFENNNDQNFWLFQLSSEIILKIFRMLCAEDLLTMQSFKNERITRLAQCVENACFDVHQVTVVEKITTFFTKERINYVKTINFNFLFHESVSTLEKAICKCKHLEELSVVCCGLTFFSLFRIFSKLQKIKVLSWDLPEKYVDNKNYEELAFSSVEELHVYVTENITNIRFLLNHCKNIKRLKIDFFSPIMKKTNPLLSYLSTTELQNLEYFSCKGFGLDYSYDKNYQMRTVIRTTAHILVSYARLESQLGRLILDRIFKDENSKVNVMQFQRLWEHRPGFNSHLFESEELDDLCQLPNESLEALAVVSATFLPSVCETIERVGGKNLKHFMLFSAHITQSPEHYMTLGKLGVIFKACSNITVLDLKSFHFFKDFGGFIGKAIKNLKSLRCLHLPSCIFQDLVDSSNQGCEFDEMVKSCSMVEQFSLCGCACSCCKVEPCDIDIQSIQKWPKLKHLTLMNLLRVRLCSFLAPMSNSCPELRSLQMMHVGLVSWQYLSNVKSLLRNSKTLTFLRLNQGSLYLDDPGFWQSLAMAKNLEGLCLATSSKAYLSHAAIMRAIEQLPRLNLFHLDGGMRNCFKKLVLRSMKSNGVLHPRVSLDGDSYLDNPKSPTCRRLHFELSTPGGFPFCAQRQICD